MVEMGFRFTERARQAVIYAQEEAESFGEGFVSSEHLLLGLLRVTECSAASVLQTMCLSLDKMRYEIVRELPRTEDHILQGLYLTPRAKCVLDYAHENAKRFDHRSIGTEHLLLGIFNRGGGLIEPLMAKLGFKYVQVLAAVKEFQQAHPRSENDAPGETLQEVKARLQAAAKKKPFQRPQPVFKLVPIVGEAVLNARFLNGNIVLLTEPGLLSENSDLEKARSLALAQMNAKAQALNASRVLDFRFQYQLLEADGTSVLIVIATGTAEISKGELTYVDDNHHYR